MTQELKKSACTAPVMRPQTWLNHEFRVRGRPPAKRRTQELIKVILCRFIDWRNPTWNGTLYAVSINKCAVSHQICAVRTSGCRTTFPCVLKNAIKFDHPSLSVQWTSRFSNLLGGANLMCFARIHTWLQLATMMPAMMGARPVIGVVGRSLTRHRF
jgi:hypothetical protein